MTDGLNIHLVHLSEDQGNGLLYQGITKFIHHRELDLFLLCDSQKLYNIYRYLPSCYIFSGRALILLSMFFPNVDSSFHIIIVLLSFWIRYIDYKSLLKAVAFYAAYTLRLHCNPRKPIGNKISELLARDRSLRPVKWTISYSGA